MGVEWRVGVLRAGAENVAWEQGGTAEGWAEARFAAVTGLTELVRSEGRQEYRVEVGDVVGIVSPGLNRNGEVDTADLGSAIPRHRD